MPFFLPEFPEELRSREEPTRGLMALLMLHDIGVWPLWCNEAVVNEALAALDEFGYVDAEFMPYFGPEPPAATGTPDVLCSAYRRAADGAVLLIAGNVGRADREVRAVLSPARLGLQPATARLWPGQTPVPLADGTLELSVPGLGYRLVFLQR
jgi:hypothetical protein